MPMKMTAKKAIIARLTEHGGELAVHEMGIQGYNENNIATRLSELAAVGIVVGRRAGGKQYKRWRMAP